jgi:hypothetical protein
MKNRGRTKPSTILNSPLRVHLWKSSISLVDSVNETVDQVVQIRVLLP